MSIYFGKLKIFF